MNISIEAMPPRRYARAAKRTAELAYELAQKAGRKVSPAIQRLVDAPEDEIARRRQEMTNDDTPTLGEIAKQLHDLKDRGVTLESLLWVAKEKVWYAN